MCQSDSCHVQNDGCLNFVDENDEVLISGFGRRGKAKGDIPGVRFKVVKVSGVGLLALWKEKKVGIGVFLYLILFSPIANARVGEAQIMIAYAFLSVISPLFSHCITCEVLERCQTHFSSWKRLNGGCTITGLVRSKRV